MYDFLFFAYNTRKLRQLSVHIHNLTKYRSFSVDSIEENINMPKVVQKKKASSSSTDSDSGPEDRTPAKKSKTDASAGSSSTNDDGDKYWELEKSKRISVRSFKGKTFVDIREFYEDKGKMKPGKKGITLQPAQWRKLLDVADEITKELDSK